MVIYIDVYFLINFCVDYIALQMTCTFFCKRGRISRLIISAISGAMASVLLLFADSVILSLLLLPVASSVMCRGVIENAGLKQVGIFWCASIFTGGFLISAEAIFKSGFSVTSAVTTLVPISLLSAIAFKRAHRSIKRSCISQSIDADIYFGGSVARVNLLIDSGNLALEPVTGRRIIILGKRAERLITIPERTEKYPVYLKSATGNSCEYAYAPDKIIFFPDVAPEDFLVLINSSCDDFAGFDGLAPTVKMR